MDSHLGGLAIVQPLPVFAPSFQNREVPSAGCLNNTANIPIKNAIQISQAMLPMPQQIVRQLRGEHLHNRAWSM
jgi:hypothetical protein